MIDMIKLPNLMSVSEFRDYMKLGNARAYELVKRRGFPSIRIGNKYYINADKLEEWFEKQYIANK